MIKKTCPKAAHQRNMAMIVDYCNGLTLEEVGAKHGRDLWSVQGSLNAMRKRYQAKHLGHLISILYQQNLL